MTPMRELTDRETDAVAGGAAPTSDNIIFIKNGFVRIAEQSPHGIQGLATVDTLGRDK